VGRNTTGPPCMSATRAPGGRPARPPAVLQTTMTVAYEQKKYCPIRRASKNQHCNRDDIADLMGWQNRRLPRATKALAPPLFELAYLSSFTDSKDVIGGQNLKTGHVTLTKSIRGYFVIRKNRQTDRHTLVKTLSRIGP